MGCKSSSPITVAKEPNERRSRTHERIKETLKKATGEKDKHGHTLTFEKILLRFEKLKSVLQSIKKVYGEKCRGGAGLTIYGLQEALTELHTRLEKEDILDIFEFVDLDDSRVIELKEFLVALTVAHALDLIPVEPADPKEDTRQASFSGAVNSTSIKALCNLIVSAYLLFDSDGKGCITKTTVQKIIDEKKSGPHNSNSNGMLSEQRWSEMDWDENGEIDFPEFVQAFSSWVNIEDEDDA